MKAMVYTKYGQPNVLKLKEVKKPVPKHNEVLVKVHAASINSWDWDLLRGTSFIARIGGVLKPKYKILGADIAGQIESVGSDVTQLQPGDVVFGDISGCGWGGFGAYVCADENAFVRKAASMSFKEAAAVPQAAVLALQGLRFKGSIQTGQKVLINGAGGGVGTFAVQIAKAFGAEVTGVDSTRKLDMIRSIGADHVIDYTKEDFTKNGQRYDVILDVVAYRPIFDYKRALNPKGRFVMVGGPTVRILQVILLGPWISMIERKKMVPLIHQPNKKDLNLIKDLIASGKVVPVIDRSYALSEVAEAFRYFGEGNVQGKVIIMLEHNNN
ncbi:NAD(P)-dependent alcohol dehydrogenase [Virgibacillus doumboii]|uniref:NAD(P)-dependent alcohol dehydrogenase n=1 Tax=Virgibacillus doumboii TaxID=2697503 RepID=UPI0013DE885F|nr:NAD(P)-dependent alcohol dehydrogenase [Virgibacillus doumboii]